MTPFPPSDVYLADCYQAIKQIPDKSIDLIVTDPPYELETRGAGFHKQRDYCDEIQDFGLANGVTDTLLSEFIRVMSKVNIYIFCNKNQLKQYFDFFSDYNCDLLIWHKTNPIPTVNNKYLSDVEYIFFAREKGVKLNGKYDALSKVYTSQTNTKDKKLFNHLTPKPLPLVKRFVENSSAENDVVLDPFCGSGTTPVACKDLNRRYIGFEINPQFYKIAKDRLNGIDAHGQTSLFIR